MSIDIDKLEKAAQMALEHFVHLDKANAAIHCGEVRFSPITFRLAEALPDLVGFDRNVTEVLSHSGQYAEDPGR